MKTLILSDLHMGHRASRYERHAAAIARLARSYDRVILNGDALEVFSCPHANADAPSMKARLSDQLEARDGPPLFLTGNHDPAISDQHFAYLEEPQLLAFHGDFVGDRAAPWKRCESIFAQMFKAALEKLETPPAFDQRCHLFREVQRAYHLQIHRKGTPHRGPLRYFLWNFVPPTKPFTILRYVLSSPTHVAALAGGFSKPVRHVTYGHTHRAGTWARGDRQVLNTGSFMPLSRPYAVQIEGAQVRLTPLAALLTQSAPVTVSASLPAGG